MPPRSKARTADSKSANVCSIHTGAAKLFKLKRHEQQLILILSTKTDYFAFNNGVLYMAGYPRGLRGQVANLLGCLRGARVRIPPLSPLKEY